MSIRSFIASTHSSRALGVAGALALSFVFASACGDDGLGNNGDGGDMSAATDGPVTVDMAHDQAVVSTGLDLAGLDFSGITCGAQTCSGSSICCVVPNLAGGTATEMCSAASSCGDGGIPAACDGPEDCNGGTPNCCIALAVGGGGMNAAGGSSCTATCPGSASQTGAGGMLDTKLCHGPTDCTGYTGTAPIVGNAPFDKCCGYPGVAFRFCAPGLITLVSSSITCD